MSFLLGVLATCFAVWLVTVITRPAREYPVNPRYTDWMGRELPIKRKG